MRSSQLKQHGVSLIEVMIAVIVLSIGILGLAALQTRALSDNGSATSRSAATVASYSILEVMRADRSNASLGKYNGTVTANSCPAADSTYANTQLHDWCTNQLGTALGAVSTTTGTINCANNICQITITFDDSKGSSGNPSQTVVTRAAL